MLLFFANEKRIHSKTQKKYLLTRNEMYDTFELRLGEGFFRITDKAYMKMLK